MGLIFVDIIIIIIFFFFFCEERFIWVCVYSYFVSVIFFFDIFLICSILIFIMFVRA